MMDNLIWVALNFLRGKKYGEQLIAAALEQFSNGKEVAVPISKDDYKKAKREVELSQKKGFKVITIDSEEYPKQLRNIKDPPIVIYIKGNIVKSDEKAISIVGSRKCTVYGRSTAETFAKELASKNITIVSGLAMGIDTASHKGALAAKGRTIAVLGSGLDRIYPSCNKDLYREIAKSGAVISEFPLGTPPFSYNFPFRNRIISGLSIATLVVEAAEHSGSLITARLAAEQGREVFAIPGNITSNTSKGTNQLIKDGAIPVTDVNDILEYLGMDTEQNKKELPLSDEEKAVLEVMDNGAKTAETIAKETGIAPSKLVSLLTYMEVKGFIKRVAGRFTKIL